MEVILIPVLVVLIYLAGSLKIIGPKELGCIIRFGKPLKNVSSGLILVPLGIYTLETETRLVIQDELPAEPDKIYRGSPEDKAGETVPKDMQVLGFKPPIRVTFSDHNAESDAERIKKDDPYDRRLTAEVVPIVRWKIDDFKKFLTTIGSVENARKQMEDTCVNTFTDVLGLVSPAVALRRKERYSNELKTRIESLVAGWGVYIENSQIKGINFSHSLNTAVQNVVVQERQKRASILEGEGQGGKEKAILNGRTAGLTKMRKDLKVNGSAVLGAETARAIAGEGDKSSQRTIIAGSGGFADLVGVGAAIAKSFEDKKGDAP